MKITATREEKIWTVGTILFILLVMVVVVLNFDTQKASANDSVTVNTLSSVIKNDGEYAITDICVSKNIDGAEEAFYNDINNIMNEQGYLTEQQYSVAIFLCEHYGYVLPNNLVVRFNKDNK